MTHLNEQQAFMVLNGLSSIGPMTIKKLLPAFNNDIRRLFSSSAGELRERGGVSEKVAEVIFNWRRWFDLEKEEKSLGALNGQFIHWFHNEYPPLLKEIYDPPLGLYCLGKLPPHVKTIAIIGSRKASLYGLKVAKQLASELARLGFSIISGMARGIDSAAHEGALEANGHTVAVLGCGVNVIYPSENGALYKKISQSGAVVSEFSLGRMVDKTTFPMRNRIISGFSRAVVIVESDKNGGSMITANFAAEHGRSLLVVPGRIDQSSSRGCHHLIRDGATLITCVDDILEEIHYQAQLELPLASMAQNKTSPTPLMALSENEQKIYKCLDEDGMKTIDDLSLMTSLSISEVASLLLKMELKKMLVKRADGLFELHSYDAKN
ncbi:MAG: DNA protecting protein DprA [Verrucomicrobia bacterium GWC2_42_7]|nr:MAG: DNA protecting protein DprA [Verrucomicrobia bacterium GWC2_42_7]